MTKRTSKYSALAKTPVPQSEPLDARQVKNSAGGYTYALDKWGRLDRFLVLGSDSPTYYASAQKLTRENAACVTACYDEDAVKTVATIVAVSDAGRAPKNDPAIFALALGAAHKDEKVRAAALSALPKVCRIGTHVFQFVDNVKSLGKGWGRAHKRALSNWYNARTVESVGYQAIKYRQRNGWSHNDILKLAHPAADSEQRKTLYRWIRGLCKDRAEFDLLPQQVQAHILAMNSEKPEWADKVDVLDLVKKANLPWEALPTSANTDPRIWEAMLPTMGMTAMLRNLANMTRHGTIKPMSDSERLIVERLSDVSELKKARIHPFNLLVAQVTYEAGRSFRAGMRGGDVKTWQPSQPIVAALDSAFYKAFANVEPTGKRRLVALDVSGSMSSPFADSPLSVRAASSAMALVTLNTEKQTHIIGFTGGGGLRGMGGYWASQRDQSSKAVEPLKINAKMSLKQVCDYTERLPMGTTDCALPMLYAIDNGLEVDCFEIYTDNESWAGKVHAMEALRQYRKKSGINAKLVAVGMTATEYSVADESDVGALNVVGFDSAAPSVIADFIRG